MSGRKNGTHPRGDARDAEISRIAIYGTLRDYFFVLAAFALWQLRAMHANKRISSISFYVSRVYVGADLLRLVTSSPNANESAYM